MDGAKPVDEGVIVLNVHICGGVVVERVDLVGGVVFTFKYVSIRKTVEALVDRGTEAWEIIWRGCVMD